MVSEHIVGLLIAERDKINQAIEALQGKEKVAAKPMAAPSAPTPSTAVKNRKTMSAAARRKISLALKKRWATKKAA